MNTGSEKANPGVALLLTLAGGYLDAFTFVGHGRIFANSMTGNIVVMALNLAGGDWHSAGRHLFPLAGFAGGVLGAHLLGLAMSRREWFAAVAALVLELLFLAAGAAAGFSDPVLIPGISFVAALQTTMFTHSGAMPYSSVMTTGNLQKAARRFFESTIPRRDAAGIRDAGLLGAITLSFTFGAMIGTLATPRLQDRALWIPCALLAAALVYLLALGAERRAKDSTVRPSGP